MFSFLLKFRKSEFLVSKLETSVSKLVGKLRSCMPPTQNVTFRFVDLILLDIWDLVLGNFSSSGGSHRIGRVHISGKASV